MLTHTLQCPSLVCAWLLRRLATIMRGLGSPSRREMRLHGWTWPRPHRLLRSSRLMGKSFSSLVPAWCLLIPLVRALTGQTLVVRWSSSHDVLHCVSERTGVPLHAFYLTLNGKCSTEEALHSMVMHGRLRGDFSSVPGDWVCSRCHIGGCWPTKSRCFRCGAPRHSAPQDVGPTLPRRESHHPGRAPKPKPAPVNPTFREPRVILPKRGGTPPASSAPSPVTTASQLDPTAIVTLLRSLGLTEDLLSQVPLCCLEL